MTDDDVSCCMENVRLDELLPATCTSLRCLAHDVCAAPDLETAKAAVVKHDRYLYLLATLVALVLLWALVRGAAPPLTGSNLRASPSAPSAFPHGTPYRRFAFL